MSSRRLLDLHSVYKRRSLAHATGRADDRLAYIICSIIIIYMHVIFALRKCASLMSIQPVHAMMYSIHILEIGQLLLVARKTGIGTGRFSKKPVRDGPILVFRQAIHHLEMLYSKIGHLLFIPTRSAIIGYFIGIMNKVTATQCG
jgi:hypothetical protein